MQFYIPNIVPQQVAYTEMGVCAGFPSPAMDYTTESINLNTVLVRDKGVTRIAYADSELTFGARVKAGDILIMNTVARPRNNDLVVCCIDGGYVLKRARMDNNRLVLYAPVKDVKPIVLNEGEDWSVFAVVTYSIRPHREDIHKSFPVHTDYEGEETTINLHKELIKDSPSVFITYVKGNSMHRAHVHNKDMLIVDKLLEPRNNDLVVAYLDREFTLKRIRIEKDEVWLLPANDHFQPIRVTKDNELIIWGVVTYSIRNQLNHG